MATDLTKMMDEYCLNITRVLLLSVKKYRFNELYDTVYKMGKRMSKPTFSDHLKDLVKKGVVLREVKGVQHVTYVFNYDKFLHLSEIIEKKGIPDEETVQRERFNSLTVEELVKRIVVSMIDKNLKELRLDVLSSINPKEQFGYNLEKMLVSRAISIYWQWLLEKCSADKKYGEKVLERIKLLTDRHKSKPIETYDDRSVEDLSLIHI